MFAMASRSCGIALDDVSFEMASRDTSKLEIDLVTRSLIRSCFCLINW